MYTKPRSDSETIIPDEQPVILQTYPPVATLRPKRDPDLDQSSMEIQSEASGRSSGLVQESALHSQTDAPTFKLSSSPNQRSYNHGDIPEEPSPIEGA